MVTIVKFCQTQIMGVADCCSKAIILLCHTPKNTWEEYILCIFLFQWRYLLPLLIWLPVFLVNALTKSNSSNSNINCQQLT